VASLGREEDAADRGVGSQAAEGVGDRGEHLAVHGVKLVGAGKLHDGDSPVLLNLDTLAQSALPRHPSGSWNLTSSVGLGRERKGRFQLSLE
jgi:hypothetical protein